MPAQNSLQNRHWYGRDSQAGQNPTHWRER
jgi:hypothetical protein